MKRVTITALLAAGALVAAPPLNAQADPLPPGGIIDIGDARWWIDVYGIAYGWDTGDVYDPDGYVYYPGFYEDNADYLYCPAPATTATMTTQSNGDVVIDCASDEFTNHVGVTATYQIRLYAGTATGYLARSLVTIRNTTDTAVPLAELWGYWYTTYVDVDGLTFLTDSGKTSPETTAAADAWFIAGAPNGGSVIWASAWAKPGSTASAGMAASGDTDAVYVNFPDATVPAGGTLRLLQFTNMVIPATQNEAGTTAAWAAAVAQVPEFATFSTTCGRLSAGLEPGVEYLGWGVPGACAPILPVSGPADAGATAFVAGALLVAGLAAVLIVRRRNQVTAD